MSAVGIEDLIGDTSDAIKSLRIADANQPSLVIGGASPLIP